MMLKLATTREYAKRALLSYLRSSFAKINMNSEKRVVLSTYFMKQATRAAGN